jgi:hypothetical protein
MSLVSALFLVAVTSTSASAHAVYANGYTWYSSDEQFCMTQKSLIQESPSISNGIRTQGQASDYEKAEGIPSGNCDGALHLKWNRPPEMIRVNPVLWVWDAAAQEWGLCRDQGWWYSQENNENQFSHFHDYGQGGTCGRPKYYGLENLAQTWYSGNWRPASGGWIWSGSHFFDSF